MNKEYPVSGKISVRLLKAIAVACLLSVMLLAFYRVNRGPKNSYLKANSKVTILKKDGRYNFYKDGKPFLVKGGAGFTHIPELVACGGNTIICWDTSKLQATFAEAEKNNVAVIIGIDIPGGENEAFYSRDSNIKKLFTHYQGIVERYKGQSSLLAWCLGNELHMPVSLTTTPYYNSYNRLLAMIHDKDRDHPVSTAVINVPKRYILNIQWRIPSLDFLCINTYNRIKSIEEDLGTMQLFWNGPFLIGEWSPNGGWEAASTTWQAPIENTSTQKAKLYSEFYTRYMPLNNPRFLGSMVFYWGNRQEYTHTWYSIFNEDDCPTEAMEVLNDCWKDTVTRHLSPRLQYMLLDKLGGNDNIILSAGSLHQATVYLEKPAMADTLAYQWQIVKEDWQHWGLTWDNFKKPAVQKGLIRENAYNQISFTAPAAEGPYRLFVTVKNTSGFCATANTPFYVVQ